MNVYFFDTSGLLKRYVQEKGTVWVESTLSNPNYSLYMAQITKIELASAIYRRHREGLLPQSGVDDAFLLFRRHIKYQYNVVRLTNEVISQAQILLGKYPLRAYDATQLSSALMVKRALNLAVNFVCADARLHYAAQLEGLNPIDPNQYP